METLILFLTMLFSNPTAVLNSNSTLNATETSRNDDSKIVVHNSNLDEVLGFIR